MNQPIKSSFIFDIKSLAQSLKLASIDVIKTSQMDIESHWFRSNGPADLFYWKTPKKLVKHQVSLFNQVVEWNEYDGVKTGYFIEDYSQPSSDNICFDEDINEHLIRQVIDLVEHVPALDPKVREQLISNYRFYNRWASLKPIKGLKKAFKKYFKKS